MIDVGRDPRRQKGAAQALAAHTGHYALVSSINVYASPLPPASDENAPLLSPNDCGYGSTKPVCEQAVQTAFDRTGAS